MAILRVCLGPGCRVLVDGGGRCANCAPQYERERLEREPWTKLYDDPRWRRLAYEMKERCGWRCELMHEGRRCANTDPLSTHHKIKVRVLWQRAQGDYESFMAMALDEANLIVLCERHHREADSNKPAVRPPRFANSQEQRYWRHTRRRKGAGNRKKKTSQRRTIKQEEW